jgi:uncharacterized protein
MRVYIDDLNENGLNLAFEEGADSFPALGEIAARSEYAFLVPLSIRVQMQRVGDMFVAIGRFDTRIRFTCSRCLEPYEAPLASDFNLTYIQQLPDTADPTLHAEIDLPAEEIGMIQFYGDEIDLRDAVQEEVVMALPMQTLCQADCKGLCPHCGADLNQGDCGCKRKFVNSQFAALKGLKLYKR